MGVGEEGDEGVVMAGGCWDCAAVSWLSLRFTNRANPGAKPITGF